MSEAEDLRCACGAAAPARRAGLAREGFAALRMRPASFTALLGPLKGGALQGLRQAIVRHPRRFAWARRPLPRALGLTDGRDRVPAIARAGR